MKSPKVSVIVAAYNCAHFIEETIRSVLVQSFRDFELIVVDDGSTDGTGEIIRRAAAMDTRIKPITQNNSGTAGGARNAGLRVATGAYVSFLDGDDTYHPQKLELESAILDRHDEVGMVFHDFQLMDQGGKVFPGTYLGNCSYLKRAGSALEQIGEYEFISTELFYPFMTTEVTGIHTSSVMVRRGALPQNELVFDPLQPIGEDIDLWFRVAFRSRVAYLDRVLSYYRQHPDSVTRNLERLATGFIFAHSKNLERAKTRLNTHQINICKKKLAAQWFEVGHHQRVRGARSQSVRSFLKSLVISFSAKTLIALIKTISGIKPRT